MSRQKWAEDSADLRAKIYSSLHLPDRKHLRLLTLPPGKYEDPLILHVEVHSLESAPPFNAVSYVWGVQEPRTWITCNGLPTTIGPSLNNGLLLIRRENESLTLWIDALCINQEDDAEKSQHVARMIDIYQMASRVFIWLGEDIHGVAEEAIHLLNTTSDLARVEIDPAHLSNILAYKKEVFTAQDYVNRGLPEPKSEKWHAVFKFLEAPWFKRMWVMQEAAAVSDNSVMYFGKHLTDWPTIGLGVSWILMRFMNNHDFTQEVSDSVFRAAFSWSHNLDYDRFRPRYALHSMLASCRYFSCEDPRDRVFSLLGLTKEYSLLNSTGSLAALMPDYSKSTIDVFCDAACCILEQSEQNDPHDFSNRLLKLWGLRDDLQPGWPSWVPRFDSERWDEALGATAIAESGYCAAMATLPQWQRTESNRAMRLRGLQVDTIESIDESLIFSHTATEAEQWNAIRQLWIGYQDLLKRRDDVAQDSSKIEEMINFALTVTAWSWYLMPEMTHFLAPDFVGWMQSRQKETEEKLRAKGVGDDEIEAYAEESHLPDFQTPNCSVENVFGNKVDIACRLRKAFFTTRKGFIGLGFRNIKPKDLVCVLYGFKIPVILRQMDDRYQLLGMCHIPALRKGKAIPMKDTGMASERWLEIQ